MSAETPANSENDPAAVQLYEGEFGPAELIQSSTTDGYVQQAENYTEPGTRIEWENGVHTSAAPNRRALITAEDGSMYYLRGNMLCDLSASAAADELIVQRLNPNAAMPNVTVGETTTLFGKSGNVQRVMIATDKVEEIDPTATRPLESNIDTAEIVFNGVYERSFDKLIRSRKQAAAPAKKPAAPAATPVVTPSQTKALRIQQAQADVDDAAKRPQRPQREPKPLPTGYSGLSPDEVGIFPTQHTWTRSNNRLGQTYNVVEGSAYDKFDAKPGPMSESDIEISPRPRLYFKAHNTVAAEREVTNAKYEKAYSKAIAAGKSEDEAVAAAHEKVRKYWAELEKTALKEAEEKRTAPYVPRQPGDGFTDMGRVLEEPRHAWKTLLGLGHRHEHDNEHDNEHETEEDGHGKKPTDKKKH